jgi:hypothetical protein
MLPSTSLQSPSVRPVFEELGGVGAGEEVDYPVGEYPRPVEVVPELVEVDALPDDRTDPTADLGAEGVDEGAALSQVDTSRRAINPSLL